MTKVQHRILVNVPVSVAYNQWTQFEDFPHFMNGIKKVTQLSDDRLEWVAEIAGVRRKWEAKILEQIPDTKIAWAATEGATNAGQVVFEDIGGGQTSLQLTLEYEPEGLVEKVGDKLNVVERQTENDLERFKKLIEAEGYASGAWRGTVQDVPGTPGIEDADASRGDSGKAGVSGKVVAAGVAAAAAAAVGVAAAKKKESPDVEVEETEIDAVTIIPADTVTPVDTVIVTSEYETSPGTAAPDEPLMTDVVDPDVDPTLRGDSPDR
jgi:ribosome-associated toxin RatA of RatAB toxin-antitoxin module